MASKIMPFLNRFLPANIAAKGLKKLSPTASRFLTLSGIAGYGADAALDYLRENYGVEKEKRELGAKPLKRPDEEALLGQLKERGLPEDLLQKGLRATGDIGALATLFGGQEPEVPQAGPQAAQGKPEVMPQEQETAADPIAVFRKYEKDYPHVIQPLLQQVQAGNDVNQVLQAISSQGRVPQGVLRSLQDKRPTRS